jgi:hypothetical protein
VEPGDPPEHVDEPTERSDRRGRTARQRPRPDAPDAPPRSGAGPDVRNTGYDDDPSAPTG